MWRICIDSGGTFTDCVAVGPGLCRRVKVLSSGVLRARLEGFGGPGRVRVAERWGAPAGFAVGMRIENTGGSARVVEHVPVGDGASILGLEEDLGLAPGGIVELRCGLEPPLLAAHLATGTPLGRDLPPIEMRLATTRGTNALLERRGGRVVLFVTRGFRDVLNIGTQQRPELFALNIRRPPPLYERVIEVPGRIGALGETIEALDLTPIEGEVEAALLAGTRMAAVALMHAWVNSEHERRLREFLRRKGFEHVSSSVDLSPTIKLLPRAQTAVVNSYLAPSIIGYLEAVDRGVGARAAEHTETRGENTARGESSLLVMTSAGGLVRAAGYAAKDSLLSGPAAGVIGAAEAAQRSGYSRIITLDMGGTSTDVARFDGACEYVFEHSVGDARIAAPAVAVESVAAGGGSVCGVGPEGLEVGPRSAGSMPGPACYGAGGPLTITDVNLLLGRLDSRRFGIPLVERAARLRAEELAERLLEVTGERLPLDAMLGALIEIADERMAEAVRRISLRRGFDPAEHAVVAFGGAGGQHACGVAERLGGSTVLIPRDVGLLSAVGLSAAVIERFAERQVLRGVTEAASEWPKLLDELRERAVSAVAAEGVPRGEISVRRRLVSMRLAGQDGGLTVEAGESDGINRLAEGFIERYREIYGYEPGSSATIEVESVRIVAGARQARAGPQPPRQAGPGAASVMRMWIGGSWREAPMHERSDLAPGSAVPGPALVIEEHGATVVSPGWIARIDGAGAIVMTRRAAAEPLGRLDADSVVRPEILAGRLRTIASEMGETLRRTALSTNVKERLDFSCAVLDADGCLIVNAPHIPVHLGALGVCVRLVREALPIDPGDVIVTNHPGFGGSHLPDVTVIMPVDEGGRRIGYVANRAHHAEIGGTRPGSMPPGAKCLAEEGVVIPPMHAVRRGEPRLDSVRRVLETARFPTRSIGENMADLGAQIASARAGAASLAALWREAGVALQAAMRGLLERAETRCRDALRGLVAQRGTVAAGGPKAGPCFAAEERLDDGSPIKVRIDVTDAVAAVDFEGSAGVHPGNFNAPEGVVRSAVMYVLRLLINEDLPLNEGAMRAVDLRIPRGMLSPMFPADAAHCPAVAAGNVETSQRVVDTLMKALGLAACGQGTMNNIIFGNARFGYYETVGGGSGAGDGFHGCSGVHTHMTNTAITDPEIVERRYPVRLVRFGLRTGSGGQGRWRGGDGIVREFEFLQPASLSVIGQHRIEAPFGLAGGLPAALGAQRIVRRDGRVEVLPGVAGAEVERGDRLIVETPGGGGYGAPLIDAT